jgi:hypothetical protein
MRNSTWFSWLEHFRGISGLTDKTFQKLFLEAVDSAFSSLGESARQSIYFHLENKFKIAKDEIPCRIEDFENGLEKIFGEGNRFLEVLIMRKLYEKLGSEGNILKWDESRQFRFVDYVKAAERHFSQKKKEN